MSRNLAPLAILLGIAGLIAVYDLSMFLCGQPTLTAWFRDLGARHPWTRWAVVAVLVALLVHLYYRGCDR